MEFGRENGHCMAWCDRRGWNQTDSRYDTHGLNLTFQLYTHCVQWTSGLCQGRLNEGPAVSDSDATEYKSPESGRREVSTRPRELYGTIEDTSLVEHIEPIKFELPGTALHHTTGLKSLQPHSSEQTRAEKGRGTEIICFSLVYMIET